MEGHTLFTDEDGDTFWWKDCEVLGCDNQVCVWLSDTKCHPHAQKHQIEMRARIEALMRIVH